MLYCRQKPRLVKHISCNDFPNDQFRRDMVPTLSLTNLGKCSFDSFKKLASKLLEFFTPLKEKNIQFNQAPFISNKL